MILMLNNRLGEINTNRFGKIMKIIEYNKAIDIVVEFQDKYKYKKKTSYKKFKDGEVSNPYDKSFYGVGFLGIGEYNTKDLAFKYWSTMIQRCYDEKFINKHSNYENHTVCEEWHNFQNFAEWFRLNYYTVGNERMELDNNILNKHNTEYCAEYSIFAPQRINTLFVKTYGAKDRNNLVGTSFHKASNKWRWQCSYKENSEYKRAYGQCDSELEAFKCYKIFKENYIKQVADEYEPYIPRELYKGMYEYEIEIDD